MCNDLIPSLYFQGQDDVTFKGQNLMLMYSWLCLYCNLCIDAQGKNFVLDKTMSIFPSRSRSYEIMSCCDIPIL